jgi:hypothetical protein
LNGGNAGADTLTRDRRNKHRPFWRCGGIGKAYCRHFQTLHGSLHAAQRRIHRGIDAAGDDFRHALKLTEIRK